MAEEKKSVDRFLSRRSKVIKFATGKSPLDEMSSDSDSDDDTGDYTEGTLRYMYKDKNLKLKSSDSLAMKKYKLCLLSLYEDDYQFNLDIGNKKFKKDQESITIE